MISSSDTLAQEQGWLTTALRVRSVALTALSQLVSSASALTATDRLSLLVILDDTTTGITTLSEKAPLDTTRVAISRAR